MNDYHDVSLKEYRLAQVCEVAKNRKNLDIVSGGESTKRDNVFARESSEIVFSKVLIRKGRYF